jgi:CheY-like chemotaxis protein
MAKLLIVEDDDALRDGLEEVLVLVYEHEVRALKSAEAALSAIKADVPDLVISDVRMPEMTGPQLLNAIRAHSKWEDLPFLFISASIVEEMERQIAAREGVFFLRKPFEIETLQEVIVAALEAPSSKVHPR